MKLGVIILSLLILFPAISAAQINMNPSYAQGETLIASVSGNFLSQIQQQNVLLYNGHVRVSFIPVIEKMNDSFYIYGQLNNRSAGNYSIVISGVSYFQGAQVSSSDITKNFTITNSTADFSVDPGFVDSGGNFSISVWNLNENPITITYWTQNSTSSGNFLESLFGSNAPSGSQTIFLQSGQIKSVYFSVNGSSVQQQLYAILETSNTSYEIPVFIEPFQNQGSSGNAIIPSSGIEIQPSAANVSLSTNSTTSRYIYIYNHDNQSSANVSLSVSPSISQYVSVPNETFEIPYNSSIKIMINFTSGAGEGIFSGQINALSANSNYSMSISLNFSNSFLPSSSDTSSLFQTCSQLNGNICGENQTCSGQTTNAQDGVCCLATCRAISNDQAGKIIGWTIVAIIVFLLIAFIIMRYRKASRPFNLLDFMRKRK